MNFTVTVTKEEMDVIGAALGELPLKQSMGVWLNLRQQTAAQMDSHAKSEALAEALKSAANQNAEAATATTEAVEESPIVGETGAA